MQAFPEGQKVVGIVAGNSTGYVAEVFRQWSAGNAVVTLRGADDHERIGLCSVSEVIEPDAAAGWVEGHGALSSAMVTVAPSLSLSQ